MDYFFKTNKYIFFHYKLNNFVVWCNWSPIKLLGYF